MNVKFKNMKKILLALVTSILVFSCGIRKAQLAKKDTQTMEIPATQVVEEAVMEEAPLPPPPPPPSGSEKIFLVVEDMPRFPGCEEMEGSKSEKKACGNGKMLEFVYDNIVYPEAARKAGIEGTIIVSFIITKKGSTKNPKIMRGIGAECDAEVIRIINLMNEKGIQWIPGKQRGNPVDVRFNMPVKFRL
jgi:protein TonB